MTLSMETTVAVLFGDDFEIKAIERLLRPGPKDAKSWAKDLARFPKLLTLAAETADWSADLDRVKGYLDQRKDLEQTLLLVGEAPARFDTWLSASKHEWPKLGVLRVGPSAERETDQIATALEQVEDLTERRFGGAERARMVALAAGGIAGLALEVWREAHHGMPAPRRRPARRGIRFPRDGSSADYPGRTATPLDREERDTIRKFGDQVIDAYLALTDPNAGDGEKARDAIDALIADEVRFKVRRIATGRTAPKKASGWSPPELLVALVAETVDRDLVPLALYRHAEGFGSPWTHPLDWVVAWTEEESADQPVLVDLDVEIHGEQETKALGELVRNHHARALRAAELEAVAVPAGVGMRLQIRPRRSADGPNAPRSPRQADCLSELLDAVLDELLLLNRPLRAWSSSFFVPFAIDEERKFLALRRQAIEAALSNKTGVELVAFEEDDEQRLYFGADSRDVITPTAAHVKTCHWGFKGCGDVDLDRCLLAVDLPVEGLCFSLDRHGFERPKDLPFRGLRLYFFYAECAALEWRFGEEHPRDDGFRKQGDDDDLEGTPPLWPLLLDGIERPTALGDLLDFNQAARVVYGAFKAEESEADALETLQTLTVDDRVRGRLLLGAEPSADEIEGWFEALLDHVLRAIGIVPVRPDSDCRLLIDERARVVTSAVPLGRAPATEAGRERFQGLLTRLHTVEQMGEGCAYDPAIALDDLARGHYRRFAGAGSHFMVSEQGFAFLGFGDYARAPIHERHMAGVYLRMARLTQFYAAIMRALRHRLARALEGWPPVRGPIRLPAAYQRIERRMLTFNNLVWFTQPSSQIQATELFDLLLDNSRAADERALLTEETERTDNHVEDAIERRGERLVRTLGLLGAPLALFFGLLGLEGFAKPGETGDPAIFAWGWKSLTQIGRSLDAPTWAIAAAISAALGAFLARATHHGWSRRLQLVFGAALAGMVGLALPIWPYEARFAALIAGAIVLAVLCIRLVRRASD